MSDDAAGVTTNGVRRIYRILCHLAWCDGDVASAERSYLDRLREQFGIGDTEALELEAAGKLGEGLTMGKREDERALLIDCMIDVTMADGVLAAPEQKKLIKIGTKLGLSERTLAERILQRARAGGKRLQASEGA